MAVLFERVPSAWTRQTKFQPLGGNPGASLGRTTSEMRTGTGTGRGRGRGRGRKRGRSRNHMERGRYLRDGGRARTFRAGWLAVLGRAARRRPRLPTRAARPDWETTHVALLTTTFRMDMDRKLRHGGLRRMWRRLYGRALRDAASGVEEPLTVWGVPKSWRDPNVDASGEEGEERNIRLTLTHRGRVVDVMEVDAGGCGRRGFEDESIANATKTRLVFQTRHASFLSLILERLPRGRSPPPSRATPRNAPSPPPPLLLARPRPAAAAARPPPSSPLPSSSVSSRRRR